MSTPGSLLPVSFFVRREQRWRMATIVAAMRVVNDI